MDDFNFWWYIIAAAIYFLTRRKKKKSQKKIPSGTENTPQRNQRPKSFEELLQEITKGSRPESPEQEPIEIKPEKKQPSKQEENIRHTGEGRAFADDESKQVYEESVKMAEGADIAFERDEHFKKPRQFEEKSEKEKSYAEELMDVFDADKAKKAVIYSEIFTRKY